MIVLALMLAAVADQVVPVPQLATTCGSSDPAVCAALASPLLLTYPVGTYPPPQPSGQATGISVLVEPVPMNWTRAALGTRVSPAVGRWKLTFTGRSGQQLSWEQVNIAMAIWASGRRIPKPVFLTEAEVFPILLRSAGGNWRVVQRLVKYAGLGVGMTVFPPAAGAETLIELLTEGVGARIPDVSRLRADLPRVLTIPESGGLTIDLWSTQIRSPQVLGPFEVQP